MKFCLEATRGEDAPNLSPEETLDRMDPQRKLWLEVNNRKVVADLRLS